MPLSLAGILSALDNLAPYAALRDSLQRGGSARPALSLPLVDGAKPLLFAGLRRDLGRPVLVVVAQAARARELAEQIQILSANPGAVALLPELDAIFYERGFVDPVSIQQRIAALALLADPRGAPGALVVASVRALMHPILPPADLRAVFRSVRVGDEVPPGELVAKWTELGYRSAPLVDEPGVFSRRGGILDVFPVGWPEPVRIEFFGDEVESLRLFDPATQRSRDRIEAVLVLPAHEVLPSRGVDERLFDVDLESLRPEVRARFHRDFERLREGQAFEGVEFYSPYVRGQSPLAHLPKSGILVLDEAAQVRATAEALAQQAEELREQLVERGELPADYGRAYVPWRTLARALDVHPTLDLSWQASPTPDLAALGEAFSAPPPYGGRLNLALDESRANARAGEAVVVVTRQAQRLAELFAERDEPVAVLADLPNAPVSGAISLVQGSLAEGFVLARHSPPLTPPPLGEGKRVDAQPSSPPFPRGEGGSGGMGLRLLTDHEIFGWTKVARAVRPRPTARAELLADLEAGDHVVHVEHGVARYRGLIRMTPERAVGPEVAPAPGAVERDYLILEYAEGDRLFVPVDQADRVTRYIGAGDVEPHLSRLGTQEWVRAKARVKAAVQKMAGELLELYAARAIKAGHAFSPDQTWQGEMEAAFPYVETPDQMTAIRDIKADMERPQPMDRLLCGDVGYGKTEIAIRAAFKAVLDGKQVAVLVPTTVLAQQHFNTFRERLEAFPVRIGLLSRFRTAKEQAKTIADLKESAVDIVIGTHRLVQKDVEFKDLGLVVIDEEQRFGVGHKERLKQLRREVDVLTLSATPIPRTLHMALVGVRDMSTMETPPEDRLPIKTYVAEYDDGLIREAIIREIDRGGQVYFVHNRVQTIHTMARNLATLVPEARFAVGHGQMPEDDLEKVMVEFAAGRADVLVCSTIIESGLDIPNVNTIIVNRADTFGLAQLYQLRGRVGRGANRAYAYFLYPKGRQLSEIADKRLRTIFEATELGSGFRIAMKDLELRGAGNLLGSEQHGHVAAVGFHLYTRLLAEAVQRLKGEPHKEPPKVGIDLPLTAHLPADYVADDAIRLNLYQRLAGVTDLDALGALTLELRDRFGPPPEPALNLLYIVQLKCLGALVGVESVAATDDEIIVQLRAAARFNAGALLDRFRDRVTLRPGQVRIARRGRDLHWQDVLQQVLEMMQTRDGNHR